MDDWVRFDCPGCGKRLKAPPSGVGQRATCPRCGVKTAVPAPPPPDAPATRRERFLAAVLAGDVAATERLLDADPTLLTVKDGNGRLPLHVATETGARRARLGVAALVLRRGADVHAKDAYGDTPMMRAADYAEAEWVQLLLSHGASVGDRNSLLSTPLHLAASRGTPESVRVLVAAGAEVDAVNQEGATPLTYAACRADVLRLLFAAGARPSVEALAKAAEGGQVEAVGVHLEHGCPPNPPPGGDPPLRWAACGWAADHVRVAELLLARGADPHLANASGRRPLDSARHNNQLPAMIALLERHMRR